jgi:bifunctional DNase/RNase
VLWAAGPHTPEEIHAAREVHDTIVTALGELSDVNREVVIGFYLAGYSYTELAELLGVPVSTVKGRLFKGRRQLRRTLAPTANEVLKPDRRPRKENLMDAPELVEVKIESIRSHPDAEHHVVVLRGNDERRILPIWIGAFEANAIKMVLEGNQSARPMTHDLTLRLLGIVGAQVGQVVVNKLLGDTFYAEITTTIDQRRHVVDARPSDALALAVRAGVPIYVAQDVMEKAGGQDDDDFWKAMAEKVRQFHEANPPAMQQQPAVE